MSVAKSGKVVPLNPSTRFEVGSGELNLEDSVALLKVYRHFTRIWLARLTPSESHLLHFILDGTIGWKRLTWTFSYRYMENGDNLSDGTGLSKRQLIRLVAQLEERGIIAVDRDDMSKGLKITLNYNVMPEKQMLPYMSSDDDGGSENTASGGDGFVTPPMSNLSPPRCQDCHPIIETSSLETSSQKQEARSPGKPDDATWVSQKDLFSESRRETASPSPASRKKETSSPVAPAPSSLDGWNDPKPVKVEPHRKLLKPAAIEKTFRRAYEIENEGISGAMFIKWTKLEMGMLRQNILDRWQGTPESCHDMFDWIVRDWFMIRKKLFGWMDRPGKEGAPQVPTIGFICRHRAKIVPAWYGNKQAEWVAKIDNAEERRLQKLLLEGHSKDEAMMVIAEERAKEKMREENAKAKADAAHTLGTAQIKERKLREQIRWGVHNPHPSSQIAQQRRLAAAAAPVSDEPIMTIEELINAPYREE